MRQLTLWSLGITLLTLSHLGCSGADTSPLNPTGPTGAASSPVADLGNTYLTPAGDLAETAIGLYTITIDPDTLTATATLDRQRSVQANDDLYALPISNFLRPDSLKVESVTRDSEVVELGYSFSHPFAAASDLDAPATAKNRLDLGVTGRILFLVDSTSAGSDTYFSEPGGSVIANTEAITNADGYYAPGAMLSGTYTANTFPYKVLVDELADRRTSQADGGARSNGGNPRGNSDPTYGWTRASLGAMNDSWTGFGFLHHGQTASSSISVSRDYLAAHDFSLKTVIIVRYVDPRGGAVATEKRANRLPAATPNLAQFGYRAPHASLDVESISFAGESGGFLANFISASTLGFHVVDWDARATETTESDLAVDTTSAWHVAQGEAGVPTLAVSIPGVLGSASTIVTLDAGSQLDDDSAFGGDTDPDSGIPGDALFYSEMITKSAGSGQAEGTYTGLVRAVDVEDALGTGLVLSIDGDLVPLTTNVPRPISYQAFEVVMDDLNDAPTLTLSTPAAVQSGTSTSITVVSANDPNGETITVDIDWDDNGSYEDTRTIAAPYATPIIWNSPGATYKNATLTPVAREIPVRFTDGLIGSPIAYSPELAFTLGANRAPVFSGTPTLAVSNLPSPATFTIVAGSSSVTDPEGDPFSYRVTNNINATVVGSTTLPIAGLGPFSNPPVSSVSFTLWAIDPLHMGTGAGPVDGTAFAGINGTIDGPCTPTTLLTSWTFTSGSDGWTPGQSFAPPVNNTDGGPANSRFTRCPVKTSQGTGFAGGALTTGPNNGGCGTGDNDYGAAVDNSMISPVFSLTGRSDAELLFNSSKNGRTGSVARYRIYVSTDGGATWPIANKVYDTEKTAAGILNESNVPVSLSGFAGMSNLRLRVQYIDSTATSYSLPSSQFAGWGIDNVRILACP